MDYEKYMRSQPMTDGEEIRSFFDDDEEEEMCIPWKTQQQGNDTQAIGFVFTWKRR